MFALGSLLRNGTTDCPTIGLANHKLNARGQLAFVGRLCHMYDWQQPANNFRCLENFWKISSVTLPCLLVIGGGQ
jgi:hypothetical protein